MELFSDVFSFFDRMVFFAYVVFKMLFTVLYDSYVVLYYEIPVSLAVIIRFLKWITGKGDGPSKPSNGEVYYIKRYLFVVNFLRGHL